VIKLFLIIIIFSNFTFSQSQNSNFEFSGLDQFWKIVKIYESNREPTKSDWNNLFSTPGYRVLTSYEFTKNFFIDNFRLVFKPSESKKLESELQAGKNIHHLSHYIKVRDNKKKIKDQYKKLKSNRFNNTALSRTLEYLPQNRVSEYPPVSFVIFESNGRGSSPIVVDLAASIEWDFVSFLSHEYHHWYRNSQLRFNYGNIERSEIDLVNALSMIEAEGIADMVDKKDWFTKPNSAISTYARQFIYDVKRTPAIIKLIDSELIKIHENPNYINSAGKKILRSLPQRGHTTGYFMASLILEKFEKKELVRTVGNPFDFILLYNTAAEKSGGKYPKFSDLSIKYLNLLNIKYKK
jgi:uncharacterized protein YjaZ